MGIKSNTFCLYERKKYKVFYNYNFDKVWVVCVVSSRWSWTVDPGRVYLFIVQPSSPSLCSHFSHFIGDVFVFLFFSGFDKV